ncbi:MAG: hypothetical protein D4R81_04070 [Nitrospiraceae bacterium]|nr:MAG: hypothetical protein D4R81_04070 [Nitrospiraceae bacterium]
MEMQQCRDDLQAAADEEMQKRYGHLPEHCQMRQLASLVFKQAGDYALDKCIISEHFDMLRQTANFLEDLRGNLNPLNPSLLHPDGGGYCYGKDFYMERLSDSEKAENPEGWLSFLDRRGGNLFLEALFEKGEASKGYWPIDDLSYTCGEYLKSPWLHCEQIDRLLIHAMIYQTTLSLGDSLTTRSLNKYSEAWKKRERKANVWVIFLSLVALSVGLGAAMAYGWWAGAIAGVGFVVLLGICDDFINKDLREQQSRMLKLHSDMHGAYALMNKRPLSLSYLRERLSAIDCKGEFWPVDIFSILDSAIARGTILWGTSD